MAARSIPCIRGIRGRGAGPKLVVSREHRSVPIFFAKHSVFPFQKFLKFAIQSKSMAKRGRKSAAESNLTVLSGNAPRRPEPAEGLTARQVELWQRVTACEPAEFFQTEVARNLLADYCRYTESFEVMSQQIADFKPEWLESEDGLKRYDTLVRIRDREGQGMIRCATKLRLTNQSRYDKTVASTRSRNQAKAARPWENR